MKSQYLVLVLIAVILISGCTQAGKPDSKSVETVAPPKFTPVDISTPPKFSPEQTPASSGSLEAKLVGTWWIGKKEFAADQGGIWYPESPVDKIALKADKTWGDDKGKKGTWSVEDTEESDWGDSIDNKWVWQISSDKPKKKIVLKSSSDVASGYIEEGDTTNMFWLFYKFEGDGTNPPGQIQLRFEKLSDTPKIEPKTSAPTFNPSTDPEVSKTKVVPDLEAKLVGEWGFGTSRHLALKAGDKWELLPEAGGSTGSWELKDVTADDIKKWKDDGKISDASEILSKKLVLHDRQCTVGNKETEEIYLLVADEQRAFTSCGIGWGKL